MRNCFKTLHNQALPDWRLPSKIGRFPAATNYMPLTLSPDEAQSEVRNWPAFVKNGQEDAFLVHVRHASRRLPYYEKVIGSHSQTTLATIQRILLGASMTASHSKKHLWQGVFPAITTQMHQDGSIDLAGTAKHAEILIDSGVQGIIFLGSLGENQSLLASEKREVMAEMVRAVAKRVPVLSGVAETSTAEAIRYINDCDKLGADGVMLMPAMNYKTPEVEETLTHFRSVAGATQLPIMIYNNPISYGNDITPEMFVELAPIDRFVALKESSGNPRRITDLHNVIEGRYSIFTGVDDLALESSILGIDGWVAGTGIAFPKQNQHLWNLMQARQWEEALKIYRWFTPLLHLDTHVKFVQYIKLCAQENGIGKEWTRAPRLALRGAERESILKIIHDGIRNCPAVP
jgi:1-pyrroline-4-hydroxy-2-carboxylate deaminase